MRDRLPPRLVDLLDAEPALERTYVVGGWVRDQLLDLERSPAGDAEQDRARDVDRKADLDLEVFGVSYDELANALRRHGKVNLVGRSFGVIKLTLDDSVTWDLAIPRRDSKVGIGHKGFAVEFDPQITPAEAAARRDFTINALMLDPRTGEVLDFFDGRRHLRERVLRHTSDAFAEDPLRVLRGMQFAGRFDLVGDADTLALCRSIAPAFEELVPDRVREEWFKWASRSTRPSAGLRFLHDAGWIHHFPEIDALRGVPQDPGWHPEGDVYTHTLLACDAMATLVADAASSEDEGAAHADADLALAPDETPRTPLDVHTRVVLMLAILAHDVGKPATTEKAERDGVPRIVSPGHEPLGGPIAGRFLERIGAPRAIADRVVPLVVNHLAHLQAGTERAVRRLARRLHPATIAELAFVIRADHAARPPLPPDPPEGLTTLLRIADELAMADAAPVPILQGRHLIALGMTPGPAFGPILEAAMDAQLDGVFEDEAGAVEWARNHLDLG